MKRNTGVIYYDCTNYFFESEEEGGLRQYGRSKENRPNPIVQMGMFMDMDGFRITKTDFKSRPVYLRRDERIKAHFLTCFLALFLTKYLLKRVNLAKSKDELFSVHDLIKTLRNMDMTFIGGEGYLPAYTRTELTNRLHGSSGFRTDYQITTKRMMNTIIAQTQNTKAEK